MEERALTWLTVLHLPALIAISLKFCIIIGVGTLPLKPLILQGMQLLLELTVRGYLQEGVQQCMLHLDRSIDLKQKKNHCYAHA